MTYNNLKKFGKKIYEFDRYDGDIYLNTTEFWVYNHTLYRHDEHPNLSRYTGRTYTEECSFAEAEIYMEDFPEIKEKCIELEVGKKYERQKIKEWRLALGLTQAQFSELFNPPIPVDTIKKWDSGKIKPPDWAEGLIIEKLEGIKMITEKELLDGYTGVSNGLNYISTVNNKQINWDYRRGNNGDGYNPAREKREDSTEIYIYNSGEMISLEDGCENHPILNKMYSDYEKIIKE